jgi:PST family polysaccharide transporter
MAVGVLANKVYALYVGPEGLGYWGLLQSVFNFSLIGFGLGISTNLVRLASSAEESFSLPAYYRAAWELYLTLVALLAIIFFLARAPIAERLLAGAHPEEVFWVAGAVIFGFAMAIQVSTLNVLRQVRSIATINLLTSVCGASIGIAAVITWGERGLAMTLCLGQLAGFVLASLQVRRFFPPNIPVYSHPALGQKRLELLRRGIPFTAGTLIGGGIQVILPLLILYHLSKTDVGYFRAVQSITMIYLGFLQGSLSQDYYPRLAASSKEQVARVFRQQSLLVLGLIVPGILAVQALGPFVVKVLFTPQFLPGLEILRWQLVGDVVKVLGYLMGFMVLARLSIRSYALAEIIGGFSLAISVWFGAQWFGLFGVGASNLVAYGVYSGVLVYLLRDWLPADWATTHLPLWFLAVGLVALVGWLPGIWQAVVGVPLAGMWMMSFYFLRSRLIHHG